MIPISDALRKNRLFSALGDDTLAYAVDFFDVTGETFGRNTVIHRRGDPFTRFGLVETGIVQVYTDDIDGSRLIMANVTAGGTFGESLCYLRIAEPSLTAETTVPSSVLWLSPGRLYLPSENPTDDLLKERFLSLLADRTLQMNRRIQVLSRITLREKLIAYFSVLSHEQGNAVYITVPMSREDMAVYIGTNRSALSRELSKMKEEGILDYHQNTFRILKNKPSENET